MGFNLKSDRYYAAKPNDQLLEIAENKFSRLINTKPYALYLDESTFYKTKKLLNICIQGLIPNEMTWPELATTIEIDDGTAKTTFTEVDHFLRGLGMSNLNLSNLKVIVTDGAPVCISLGKKFAKMFKTTHVVCIAHNLNLVANDAMLEFPHISEILEKICVKLSKSVPFKKEFDSKLGISSKLSYCKTRWGSWLTAGRYFLDFYEEIFEFFSKNSNYNDIGNYLIKYRKDIENELFGLDQFSFLPGAINYLEKNCLTLKEQFDMLREVGEKLKYTYIYDRYLQVTTDNVGLLYFDEILKNDQSNEFNLFEFLKITNSETERNFSYIKNICAVNRGRISSKTINNRIMNKK